MAYATTAVTHLQTLEVHAEGSRVRLVPMKWEVRPWRGCRHDPHTQHTRVGALAQHSSRICKTREHRAERTEVYCRCHRAFAYLVLLCCGLVVSLSVYRLYVSDFSADNSRTQNNNRQPSGYASAGQPSNICRSPFMRSDSAPCSSGSCPAP